MRSTIFHSKSGLLGANGSKPPLSCGAFSRDGYHLWPMFPFQSPIQSLWSIWITTGYRFTFKASWG